jgi:2-polyprenyl-6-methoxyphenol hydroxylase-like FAD-dependent oxidoreductase
MLQRDPSEQIHDEGVHVAYFTIKKDLLQGSRLAEWHNLTGGRCVFLRPDPDPAGRTRANLLNVTWKSDISMKDKLNEALEKGNQSYLQLMEELYRDADWLTPDVLEGMHESDDFYCSLFAQVRSPKLHDGRVVLLGDTGYATPGLGTSLAIVGGYVLAGELLNHPGDIETALTQYDKLLTTFVRASQHDDIVMQLLNPQSRWGISLRNAFLWLATSIKLPELAVRIASKLGLTERPFALPEYRWPVTRK